ncbi:MAG TPA: sulfatase-like hydrolase/transferase [Blastocatellia bacterium]|nr:sulfatase-like hydrolase/transferase [Blastocatellia bacterium]
MNLSSGACRAVALYGAHLLLGSLFILLFCTLNHWGGWKFRSLFVVFHLTLHSVLWAVVLFGTGALLHTRWVARYSMLRVFLRLIPAVVFHLVFLLWWIDVATTYAWGVNVTDELVWEVLRHFDQYYRFLPLSAYGLIAALLLMGIWLYERNTRQALLDCGSLLMAGWRSLQQSMQRAPVKTIGSVTGGSLSYAVAVVALFAHPWMAQWYFWQREPLTSFVMLPRAERFGLDARPYLPNTPRRLQNAERDAQLRKNYPPLAAPKRNVAIIVVDSLRADHLPAYGYTRDTTPFLSSLAATGRLRKVEEARAACNTTYCAVLSVLASRQLNDLGRGMFQLQDLLKDQGYKTYFLVSGIHKAWYGLRELYGTSIDVFFDGTSARNYFANDDRGLVEQLAQVEPFAERPAFFYFHLMTSHIFGTRATPDATWQPANNQWGRTQSPELNVNSYDNSVRQADAIIAQLFAALEQKGYLRNALVVILGDHGEALGEHAHYHHGQSLYEEELRIPLLIVDAADVVYPSLASATQLDVAPTIVDRLGGTIPASWQGQSLLRRQEQPYTLHHAGFHDARALVYPDGHRLWKYIRSAAPLKEELYELRSDPRESRNRMQDEEGKALLPRLRALLKE